MTPVAFYHVAGIGHWREIVSEQIRLLAKAEFTGKVHIGFLGAEYEDGVIRHMAEADGINVEVKHFGSNFGEFEFPTQSWMHEVSRTLPKETPMLYFHAKGVTKTYWQWSMWRWIMNAYNISDWKTMVQLLKHKNCAGVSWYANCFPAACFPGTFWWSTAGFVSHLTPVPDYVSQFVECISKNNNNGFTKRHAAECWINSRCNADPYTVGPPSSRFWDHSWWTNPDNQEWCKLAYTKGR